MSDDPKSNDKTIVALVLGCVGLLVLGVIALVVAGALFTMNVRSRALERAKVMRQRAIAEEQLHMAVAEVEKLKAESVGCRERAAMLEAQVEKARALLVRHIDDRTRESLNKGIARDLAETEDLKKKRLEIEALINEKQARVEKLKIERAQTRRRVNR